MVVEEASINNIMGGIENTGGVRLHNHKRKLRQRFDIIKKLGQGTYGKVQLGINKETGQEVAIKTIKKSKIETEADLVRIRREIQIMSSVQHPNIIHIYEVFENREKMVLVMEYAAGGELYDYLSERKVLVEHEARRIFRQIATACYYCHKHKICHRDLKLENILLDENHNAKIADFGLSNVFDDQRLLSTFCGSPLYASPEIVKGTPYHGPEVDCWSLGVLLYTLVYGAMPFDGSNFKRLVKQISQGDYFEPKHPSPASPLIKEMLTVNPKNRANIEKICMHWWVNETYEESCLDISEELALQTPVRLDVLLSLAPPPPQLESDKLVVTGEDEMKPELGHPTRSHSVGSLMDLGNPAERRIKDLIAEQLKVSPKRKLETTTSTANATSEGKHKDKIVKEHTVADISLRGKHQLQEDGAMEVEDGYYDPSLQGAACAEIMEDARKMKDEDAKRREEALGVESAKVDVESQMEKKVEVEGKPGDAGEMREDPRKVIMTSESETAKEITANESKISEAKEEERTEAKKRPKVKRNTSLSLQAKVLEEINEHPSQENICNNVEKTERAIEETQDKENQAKEETKTPAKRKVLKKKVLSDKNENADVAIPDANLPKENGSPEVKKEVKDLKETQVTAKDVTSKEVGKVNEESKSKQIAPKESVEPANDSPSKPVERRRSRIFEQAEKFQNMITSNENKTTQPEKTKKIVIPGVSVGSYKKDFERKASLTSTSPPKVKTIPQKKPEETSNEVPASQNQTTKDKQQESPVQSPPVQSPPTPRLPTDEERKEKVKNAVNIISNALSEGARKSKSRPCMRKPPVPFGVSGRSASGSIGMISSPLSPPPDGNRLLKLQVGPNPSDTKLASVSVSTPEHIKYEQEDETGDKTSSAEITLKSATLPRRKMTKAEIKLDYPQAALPAMGFMTEMAHRVEAAPKLATQRSEVTFPVNSPPVVEFRAHSVEPERAKTTPKERIIPIAFDNTEKNNLQSPPTRPPVSRVFPNPKPLQSQRANSLSRQSTQESDSETASTGEPIRKSPREYIIPIAVEGGGYVTPRAGSLEPSESASTTSTMTGRRTSAFGRSRRLNDREGSEDESPFGALHRHSSFGKDSDTEDSRKDMFHRLRSSRPRKATMEHNDSVSSGEDDDDDGFEILTAENLFSTLLSRVRDLTQRLNVDGNRPGFPNTRLLSHFGHNSDFFNRHNLIDSQRTPLGRTFSRQTSNSSTSFGAPWRRSVSRDLASDIDTVYNSTTPTQSATLPRGDRTPKDDLNLSDLDLKKLKLTEEDALALSYLTPGLSRRIQKQLLAQLPSSELRKLKRTLSMRSADRNEERTLDRRSVDRIASTLPRRYSAEPQNSYRREITDDYKLGRGDEKEGILRRTTEILKDRSENLGEKPECFREKPGNNREKRQNLRGPKIGNGTENAETVDKEKMIASEVKLRREMRETTPRRSLLPVKANYQRFCKSEPNSEVETFADSKTYRNSSARETKTNLSFENPSRNDPLAYRSESFRERSVDSFHRSDSYRNDSFKDSSKSDSSNSVKNTNTLRTKSSNEDSSQTKFFNDDFLRTKSLNEDSSKTNSFNDESFKENFSYKNDSSYKDDISYNDELSYRSTSRNDSSYKDDSRSLSLRENDFYKSYQSKSDPQSYASDVDKSQRSAREEKPRRVSRFLRPDFFDPPKEENVLLKEKKEREMETQKVLKEIRDKRIKNRVNARRERSASRDALKVDALKGNFDPLKIDLPKQNLDFVREKSATRSFELGHPLLGGKIPDCEVTYNDTNKLVENMKNGIVESTELLRNISDNIRKLEAGKRIPNYVNVPDYVNEGIYLPEDAIEIPGCMKEECYANKANFPDYVNVPDFIHGESGAKPKNVDYVNVPLNYIPNSDSKNVADCASLKALKYTNDSNSENSEGSKTSKCSKLARPKSYPTENLITKPNLALSPDKEIEVRSKIARPKSSISKLRQPSSKIDSKTITKLNEEYEASDGKIEEEIKNLCKVTNKINNESTNERKTSQSKMNESKISQSKTNESSTNESETVESKTNDPKSYENKTKDPRTNENKTKDLLANGSKENKIKDNRITTKKDDKEKDKVNTAGKMDEPKTQESKTEGSPTPTKNKLLQSIEKKFEKLRNFGSLTEEEKRLKEDEKRLKEHKKKEEKHKGDDKKVESKSLKKKDGEMRNSPEENKLKEKSSQENQRNEIDKSLLENKTSQTQGKSEQKDGRNSQKEGKTLQKEVKQEDNKPSKKSGVENAIRRLREQSLPKNLEECATESGLIKRAVSVEDLSTLGSCSTLQPSRKSVTKILGLFKKFEEKEAKGTKIAKKKKEGTTKKTSTKLKKNEDNDSKASNGKLKKNEENLKKNECDSSILTKMVKEGFDGSKENPRSASADEKPKSKLPVNYFRRSLNLEGEVRPKSEQEVRNREPQFERRHLRLDLKNTTSSLLGDDPGNSNDFSTNLSTSRNFQEVPRNIQETSRNLQDVSRNLQDVTRNLQDVSRNVHDASRNLQDASIHLQGASRNSQDTSRDSSGIMRLSPGDLNSYEDSKASSSDPKSSCRDFREYKVVRDKSQDAFRDNRNSLTTDDSSTLLSPYDEDNWSVCSDFHREIPSPLSPNGYGYSGDENESVIDRIRRKSFYTRFNEKKRPRKSALVGSYKDMDFYNHRSSDYGSLDRSPVDFKDRHSDRNSVDYRSLDRRSSFTAAPDLKRDFRTYSRSSSLLNDGYVNVPNRYQTYNPRRRLGSLYGHVDEKDSDDLYSTEKARKFSYLPHSSRQTSTLHSPTKEDYLNRTSSSSASLPSTSRI